MDWSLLGCGAGGHVTFAPDEPGLRERFGHTTREGQAWRCLRCGTFVIGEPTASGPADSAPQVRRAEQVRSALILRFFAVERFLRALIFAALAIAIWRFSVSQLSLAGIGLACRPGSVCSAARAAISASRMDSLRSRAS